MAGTQGFASMGADKREKAEIKGGENSHGGTNRSGSNASASKNATTNKSGGGRLDHAAQSKGGKASK